MARRHPSWTTTRAWRRDNLDRYTTSVHLATIVAGGARMTTKRTLQYGRVILDPSNSVVSIVVVPATNQDLMVNETDRTFSIFLEVMMRDDR
jgi:hypothetical protein